MKTILVTGGAGFIGSNFIHELIEGESDFNIINYDCLTYAGNLENLQSLEKQPNYKFVKGDICDKKVLQKVFEENEVDYVVHFAAESHVDRSIGDPSIFLHTNIIGTFNILQAAYNCWNEDPKSMEQKRFIHVSTDEVFGSLGKEGLFREETPYQPNSPYSASKAGSDHIVRSYVHTFNMPCIITNCSNNYGPYQFPEKLIPLIINNIFNKKPLPVYGDGKNVRDWLYVRDHCRAIVRVLEKGVPGDTYNIGGHNEWTNIDIVKRICKIMDEKLSRSGETASENLITYVKDRPGHDKRYAIDASKIEKELGWTPQESFETGIEKTVDWYLENRQWLENVTSGEYTKYYEDMYLRR